MCDIMCCFGFLTLTGFRDRVCQKLVYFPPAAMYAIEQPNDPSGMTTMYILDENGNRCEPLKLRCELLKTRRGQYICCVHVPCEGANTTILYSHGNATDLGYMRDHLVKLSKALQVNILAYDYSGYGLSTGHTTPSNTYADCEAAFDHLRKTYPNQNIVLYGQSLGSGMSFYLGKKHPDVVKGIVIHSGLMSGLRVIDQNRTGPSAWFDIYPNIDIAEDVKAPVFIIHGTNDTDISVTHAEQLASMTHNCYEPWFVEDAGHNNIEAYWRAQLFSHLKQFIRDVEKGVAVQKCEMRRARLEANAAKGNNLNTDVNSNATDDDVHVQV